MPDLLTVHAANHPDEPAVIDDRGGGDVRRRTYAELEARSNQLAHVLLEHGVRAGDKVVWCGQNSIGIVEMVNASRKLGSTAVPLNYRLSDEEAAYVTDHSDARLVVVDAAYAGLCDRIRGDVPMVQSVLVFDGLAPAGAVACDPLVDAASCEPPVEDRGEAAAGATMVYTSGTTGKPKGAYRRQGSNPGQTAALLQHVGYRTDDVYPTTGPLYHSGPGGFMAIGLAMGQTIVLQYKFDPEDWRRLLETYRCTSTFAAPTPTRMICNLPADTIARFDRSSMRVMIANAAPWSFALKQRYVDGFQTVDDVAYRDDEGFLYICDRKKDMIISRGMNVYPAEIEAVLEHHPDIYEAAVFGIPSEEWGKSCTRSSSAGPVPNSATTASSTTPATTSRATRCPARCRGWTSCRRPAPARSSNVNSWPPSGRIEPRMSEPRTTAATPRQPR